MGKLKRYWIQTNMFMFLHCSIHQITIVYVLLKHLPQEENSLWLTRKLQPNFRIFPVPVNMQVWSPASLDKSDRESRMVLACTHHNDPYTYGL